MEFMMTGRDNDLTEQLLPARHSFFVRQSRSGERHTNFLVKGAVFRIFTINFFTYGFPISLLALCFWSFHFASICAFGLLAYVGYVVYAFPSLFRLHQLNGLLLVFILLWAVCTYIFNIAFLYVNWELEKDMEIWELIGLWRYSVPGYFLLAQFGLGVLVAVGNLVNDSVFTYTSSENDHIQNDDGAIEVTEETKVLAVATIAWGLRKCSRAIMLVLIFLIAMKPGLVHAVYMIFFLLYLLGHNISKKMRQALILLCEAHFALSYILHINIISEKLERYGSLTHEILMQLGLLDRDSSCDFSETALLACFCAVHNHGFEMLFSFSAVVQHTPCHPVGFSVLKAGLNKSVLMSVYSSSSSGDNSNGPSQERRISSYLSAVGQKFLALYRSWGTYIAYLTILIAVYLVRPNYISFGYVFLLLFWIIGRQLVERTKTRLWFPLKGYAIVMFVFMYSLSIFPSFQEWLSYRIDLNTSFGFKPEASLLENVSESLAILIVMQLYSYERRQSKYNSPNETDLLQSGVFGFIKRFLIWHSNKVLFVALFYASISPISAFGLLYLLGNILCSLFPKTSRIPSKSFLVYTGFIVMLQYLFQMWGQVAKMYPGQKHAEVSQFLGLRVFESGFWGIESSLRGEVLVIAACTLQYNVFRWLDMMPSTNLCKGEWDEPCPLFVSTEGDVTSSSYDEENKSGSHPTLSDIHRRTSSNSWPSIATSRSQQLDRGRESNSTHDERSSFGYYWGSMRESQKWNKRRIVGLRNERFDMQKTTLKVYLMFWIENLFNLFGLEINMMVLLLASFAFLNIISLLYIGLLAALILLDRHIIRKLWSILVFLFACVLILEYFAIWKNQFSLSVRSQTESNLRCHDCWESSKLHFQYCGWCWLGIIVDDPRMLMSYFIVFIIACFKLHADKSPSFSGPFTYHQMMAQRKNIFVWKDLSFETKSMWTFFDYLRLYCYCHLLDLVLLLILVTGTLEYDILHLGYLGFALVFFRLRPEILRKRNKIFKFLRMYNFVIIVMSLAYQSPFIGVFNEGKCGTVGYIYEVIGFYKYDYGFRITSRSALVEIIIFILVSIQSYMFSSPEFERVSRYLEAEQIGAIVREQEKKAAWKTAQLQHIRESEEKKRQRNMQVEKMKSEMLDLQVQLHTTNSPVNVGQVSPESRGLRKRRSASVNLESDARSSQKEDLMCPSFSLDGGVNEAGKLEPLWKEGQNASGDLILPTEYLGSPVSSKEFCFGEITEIEENTVHSTVEGKRESSKGQSKDHPLKQLIGDGVSQVQSLGNQAVTNLASFLNVANEDGDSNGHLSDDDGGCDEIESQHAEDVYIVRTSSLQSDKGRTMTESLRLQLGRILQHIWSQMRSNNDIVCYCCFIMVFLWNFSLLSMVYLAALFLYALCVNTGPSYTFWVVMLIYTEFFILLEYLYQIIIQHCGLTIRLPFLQELGFPYNKIKSSFVISSLPIFAVYFFTLLQSSITVQDGNWTAFSKISVFGRKMCDENLVRQFSSWREKLNKLAQLSKDVVCMMVRSCLKYWKSLTQGAESPPYFVQLSLDVGLWPEDGIQPENIESRVNNLLRIVHSEHCKEENPNVCPSASKVSIQSIERSHENPNLALAVFEVVYASPLIECIPVEGSKSLTPAADVAKEILIAKRSGITEEVGFPYPIISVIGGGKREIDLYAYIFGADLAVFFLVVIFYQSVIKNKSDFLDVYQLEDQFPKEFVFILMVIFFLIVVDRIIYLCSFATWKVLFYLFNLVLFTYSVTQYAWNMQPSPPYAGIFALRAIFLTKAVSLALQAIQIRYGMPHKSTLYHQFLTSKISRVNYLGYRIYRALPFLYELRCVLDWSCTTTSLTMYDWLKLEDINASLYLVKCDAILNRASHKQGEKQTKMTKLCNGICLFFILICVIWAPMLMYSSGNPTNIANPIKDATVQVDIKSTGGRLTLFQTTLCDKLEWDEVNENADLDPQGFFTTYNKDDVQLICCQADASTLWLVPEVVQKSFAKSIDVDMEIIFSWVFHRDRPKGKEDVKYERILGIESDLPRKSDVQAVFNGTMKSFRVSNISSRYFRVTGSGDVRPFEPEVVSADLIINRQNSEWWSFYDINPLNVTECKGLTGPSAIVVSEETPQGILGDTLSKFSIWGLYITFVLAVGRFIRLQCSDLRMRIPFENLPSCDRLIAMCEDIYAARAEGELGVEEVLYWTLVKIYRSPHMLLEYTKPD
ncbi:piezo-type mechanosensitive ion channel homolog isoform X2 [Silene latifolia]